MKSYTFRTIVEPDKPSGYHGFVPLLRGVHTYGNTLAEVKKNLKEAIICHVQGLLKDGEQIPQEHEVLELVQTFSEGELAISRK
ncbi:MAG: type II toxin-antitoxin system HicB family antitoxin [Patescibacteria group bacterium]